MTVLITAAAAVGVFVVSASAGLWAIAIYDRGKALVDSE